MNVPPNDSMFWKVCTQIIVATVAALFLALNYKNGWAPQDWITILGILASLLGGQALPNVVNLLTQGPKQ